MKEEIKKTEVSTYSKYRWVMLVIVLLMTMFFSLILLMPSSLITTISEETGWSLGQVGTFNSIVSLLMGIFVFLGSIILDKLGTKNTAVIALAIGAFGCLIAFFAGTSYALHIIGRFLFGVSFGVFFVVPGVVIAEWFPSNKQSLFQGLRGSFDLFGCGVAYYIIIPIFYLTQSWQVTFGIFGIVLAVIMLIYLVFGRNKPVSTKEKKVQEKAPDAGGQKLGILLAAKNKYVWFMVIGMMGKIFTFNTFVTFLPAFLEYERGYSLTEASSITGLVSLIGIASGLSMGVLAAAVGRRKVMGWPMLAFVSLGAVIVLFINSTFAISFGCLLLGWGVTGYMVYYLTVPVDISNGNSSFIAGSTALVLGIPYIVSFFVPNLFQGLLDAGLSIQMTMLIAVIPNTVLMIPSFFIPETGAKARKSIKAVTAEDTAVE